MSCNATLISAFQQGQIGFALSDSGWMMPWYFGVLWALQSIGVITPGVTPIGAVSGGSVAAASNCLGLDFERQVMPAAQAAASICRANNMCAGTLNSVMEPSLRSLLEPAANDATALARCNRTYVYVSEGQPGIELAPRGVHFVGSTPTLVDSSSAESLVSGVIASWFIPYYWSRLGSLATTYKGKPAYEGYFTIPMPCPPGASLCIRIASRYPGPLVEANKPWDGLLTAMAVSPALPVPPVPADIHPGKYNKCRFSAFELSTLYSITPASARDLDYLFELGKADGMAWAEEAGLTNLTACLG